MRGGFDDTYTDYVRPDVFYPCLEEFINDDLGSRFEKSLKFVQPESEIETPSEIANRRLFGYKMTATTIAIENISQQGPQMLRDFRYLESKWGVNETYSFADSYLDYE